MATISILTEVLLVVAVCFAVFEIGTIILISRGKRKFGPTFSLKLRWQILEKGFILFIGLLILSRAINNELIVDNNIMVIIMYIILYIFVSVLAITKLWKDVKK